MSSRISTSPSTGSSLAELRAALDRAGAVVVGAGAGLSASAGHAYSGPRFETHFADFIAKYHYRDMYSAGFWPYPTPEEYWAYWSRHIWLNRYAEDGGAVYGDLLELLRGRDYFVLTTNVDHCFQRAGFDKSRLFYTQGDYGLFQCSLPCRQTTYDNEKAVRRMVAEQENLRVPTALVPRCPACGEPMTVNLRCDDAFVQDPGWYAARRRYTDFLHSHDAGSVLYLELGVGYNTPAIIKYPFWRRTLANPDAVYACVNLGQAPAPKELAPRAISVDGDIARVLSALKTFS
ncbi:Sir2 silent information regulator family NAD-dependent deacetylase [Pseudoflavonifractor sp. BIOML-A6]|nr:MULTISPECIES: Sir2 silent information regulator family NAD-dependent deacetylase [unclassified Pseudoflavonifractor]MTQ95668.1 Sir2 silent information regulator family NAD-dependent deacetylase [Pseudoflavonifractor sp. BIOML-A16]MTR06050.1 Sir2 silent information regulator family NAD-dependent deacetylase [Pseudoflavonifractor sp. BIOML-A15]MTR32074.1 Sir2 silent information regulator family NAD-dependent deacetylase [Pseudoflavonifractor sp. BIOML-A14]MTR73092.1 Sir2 silent information reg